MPIREQNPPSDGALDYETSKRMAQSGDAATRAQVAGREDVRPELLYYLAIDPAVEVRREVAANPAAPSQASAVLARRFRRKRTQPVGRQARTSVAGPVAGSA